MEKGFRNRKGKWVSEPPYPWGRVDGRTCDMAIAAWQRYQNQKDRAEREKAGNPVPLMTRSEIRWVLGIIAIIILLFVL